MRKLMAAVILASACVGTLQADVSVRRRAVDMFQLQDGTRLFGVHMDSESADSVKILMRASWLRTEVPELYAASLSGRTVVPDQADSVAGQLSRHIEALRAVPQPELERIGYLQERWDGLFGKVPVEDEPDVVVLELPRSLVRQQLLKKSAMRDLAGLGILNDVATVETSDAADLTAELRKIPPARLIRDLPGMVPQKNQHEQAFQMILLNADRVFSRTCRLIYQNGQLISEAAATANPETLAVQMLSGQVQGQLQQLLGEEFGAAVPQAAKQPLAGDVLPDVAARIAEQEQARVVEVSQMDLSARDGRARVSLTVYHKNPDQTQWMKVVSVTASAGSEDISAEQQQRIADDPRVRQVTRIFSGLGAGGNDLRKAISMGAVVEVAQQRARNDLDDRLVLGMQTAGTGLQVLEAKLTELPAKVSE